MKIHIPYISDQQIGGGYTFYRNFTKAMADHMPDWQLVPEAIKHDVLFAFSPTTVSGEVIARSKAAGARFVLRMDGVPEDSRNSGRGTRRLIEYSLQADLIIYQSEFVYNTVGKILRNNGATKPHAIVRNGVDTDIFTPEGEKIAFVGKPNILSIAYRKDNNKRYEEVLAMYREYWMDNKNANLVLIGRYPSEWQDYNMGFFNGERHQRLGIVTDLKAKAAMMRSCDLMFYPSFADPAPNVVLEALACGVPILYNAYGGTREILEGTGAGMAIDYRKNFADQIEEVLEELPSHKFKARETAKNHDIKMMALHYQRAFEMLNVL